VVRAPVRDSLRVRLLETLAGDPLETCARGRAPLWKRPRTFEHSPPPPRRLVAVLDRGPTRGQGRAPRWLALDAAGDARRRLRAPPRASPPHLRHRSWRTRAVAGRAVRESTVGARAVLSVIC